MTGKLIDFVSQLKKREAEGQKLGRMNGALQRIDVTVRAIKEMQSLGFNNTEIAKTLRHAAEELEADKGGG